MEPTKYCEYYNCNEANVSAACGLHTPFKWFCNTHFLQHLKEKHINDKLTQQIVSHIKDDQRQHSYGAGVELPKEVKTFKEFNPKREKAGFV